MIRYNYRLEIIYDIINFNVVHLNKDTFVNIAKNESFPQDKLFTYYEVLKRNKGVSVPPQYLYPFFYYNGESPSALTTYLLGHFDLSLVHFKSFIDSIINNKSVFKRVAISCYCRNLPNDNIVDKVMNGDPESIAKVIAYNSYHKENLQYLVDLFYNFDGLVDALIYQLNLLFPFVERLHKSQRKNFDSIVKHILTEVNKNVINDISHIPAGIDILQQTFAICFTIPNALISVTQKVRNSTFLFLLGCDCNLEILKRKYYFKDITAYNIVKALGHDLRYAIVDQLYYGSKTITQLSSNLHLARSSIVRDISFLLNQNIIKLASIKGSEKYYSLCSNFFTVAKISLNEYLESIIRDLS